MGVTDYMHDMYNLSSGYYKINQNNTQDESILNVYETVIASVLSMLTVSSCVSNLTLIIVFIRYKCLRTKHDMLAINLAFINLLTTAGISFFSTFTLHPGVILHLEIVCLNLFILIFGGILTSLFVLLYLSLERYLCIVHPELHSQIKMRHVILCSALAYVLGLVFTAVPFMCKNNWERYHICVADVFPFEFSIAEQIIGLLIISIVIVMNVTVFRTALMQASKIHTTLKSVDHKHKYSLKHKGKAFVTVFLLSGISIICWVPLLIVFELESKPNLHEELKWMLTQLLYVPVSLNASLTGIVIGYRNRHFRDAIKSLYCKKHHECNKYSSIRC